MSEQAKSVTILGAGIIGAAMARNTTKAGLETAIWNRSAEKLEPLASAGIPTFIDAAEAVAGKDVVLSVLSDADVTLDIVGPLLGGLKEGAVWLQCATIGIEGCERVVEAAAAAGVPLVDAPVSGTKTPAEKGELVMLASGDSDAARFAAPVLDAVGSKTVWLGKAGAGSRMKLVTNTWVLDQTALVAEAIRLCEALGLEPESFLDAIDGAPVGSPYAQIKGAMMLEEDFTPNFPLEWATKDTKLIVEAARAAGLDLPLTEATNGHYLRALAKGRGKDDASAIFDYVGTQPQKAE